MHVIRYLAISWLVLSLAACSSNPPAPVVDRVPANNTSTANKPVVPSSQSKSSTNRPVYKAGDWRPDTYVVKKGDTLFSIGLEHGYDYKEIAQANDIAAPYTIKVGQSLKFSALKDKPAATESQPAQENNDGVVTYAINTSPINAEPNSTGATSTSATITSTTPTGTAQTTPTVVAISEPKAIREPYSEEALKRPLPAAKTAVEKPPVAKSIIKPIAATIPDATNKPGIEVKPEAKPELKPETKPKAESPEDIDWAWPTKGKVIANFNDASNKGVDIAGSMGQAISAAGAGKVIYSGSDLRGYGKLVIIKHNSTYLSVYAHNSLILVKEGQHVSRGQKIAEMGNTDSNTVKLHFEIRRQGKSVDPGKYLTTN